jgi:hypothetical protein
VVVGSRRSGCSDAGLTMVAWPPYGRRRSPTAPPPPEPARPGPQCRDRGPPAGQAWSAPRRPGRSAQTRRRPQPTRHARGRARVQVGRRVAPVRGGGPGPGGSLAVLASRRGRGPHPVAGLDGGVVGACGGAVQDVGDRVGDRGLGNRVGAAAGDDVAGLPPGCVGESGSHYVMFG